MNVQLFKSAHRRLILSTILSRKRPIISNDELRKHTPELCFAHILLQCRHTTAMPTKLYLVHCSKRSLSNFLAQLPKPGPHRLRVVRVQHGGAPCRMSSRLWEADSSGSCAAAAAAPWLCWPSSFTGATPNIRANFTALGSARAGNTCRACQRWQAPFPTTFVHKLRSGYRGRGGNGSCYRGWLL